MLDCSILTPAFSLNTYDYRSIQKECADSLGIEITDFELFTLVPLKGVKNPDVAIIKLKKTDFSLTSIENLISQREQIFQQLQKSREALQFYSEKIAEKKEKVFDEKGVVPEKEKPTDKTATRKISKLEEDNKKLRHLLKTQLDNAENLRLATQKTVENLKDEFDLLVRELLNVKKSKEKNEDTSKNDKKSTVPKLKIGAN